MLTNEALNSVPSQASNWDPIRSCTPDDAQALYRVVHDLQPLTVHTAYTYWVLCKYAGNTCFVAERHGSPVGLAIGLLSSTAPRTLLIWQIGVVGEFRGTGLSDALLDHMAAAGKSLHAKRLEVSIARDNRASKRALLRLAGRLGVELEDIGMAKLPGASASGEDSEVLYRIALFKSNDG
jgi:L-2,4-diaminobutyric acid acetyltransferase